MPEQKKRHLSKKSQATENINFPHLNEEEGEKGTGGSGSVDVRWVDPFAVPSRDDILPPQERSRLRKVHELKNKVLVDKQKQTIAERKLLKEGVRPQVSMQAQKKGLGSSRGNVISRFKDHPVLSKKMSGKIDDKLSPLSNENKSETNEELKNENELRNELKNQHRLQFNNTPKLRPPGT